MAVIRAQVSIPRDTNLPEDTSVNTWHFEVDDAVTVASLDPVFTALTNFYAGIDQLLSSVNASPATVKWYNLDDPQPRVPIRQENIPMTFDTGVSGMLPEEVAICLSFKAAAAAGANASRRRGRIYLGPLTSGLQAALGGRVHISPATAATVTAAGAALKAASDAAATWNWAIYSPTTHAENPGSAGIAAYPVAAGWVDNAFDTQRRRGPSSAIRLLF